MAVKCNGNHGEATAQFEEVATAKVRPLVEGVTPTPDNMTPPEFVLIDGKSFDELPPEFFHRRVEQGSDTDEDGGS